MDDATMARQIAHAAIELERQRMGHEPKSVTVVLSDDTLVVTLHGALSQAEQDLAQTSAGADQVQDFYRQSSMNSSDSLRHEITRITGVRVRESTAVVETTTGTVVKAFTTGTVVQALLLARSLSNDI